MVIGKKADYSIDFTSPESFAWTTPGPLDENNPPKSTTDHPSIALADPNTEDGFTAMKGIDVRTNKDGTETYRVRVRIKGHPPAIKSFDRLTAARRWKRKTEVEIEEGRYFDRIESRKHTLGEAIDRYLCRTLAAKSKDTKNVQRHLLWWKQQLGAYTLDAIKPSLLAEKRDFLLSNPTYRNAARSPTTVIRYIASLSHVFTIAMKE